MNTGKDKLWDKIISTIDSINSKNPQRLSSSRSSAYSNGNGNILCTYEIELADGSSKVFIIEAALESEFLKHKTEDGILISIKECFHNSESYWSEIIKNKDCPEYVFIEHVFYVIKKEPPLDKNGNLTKDGWGLGFDGKKFTLQFISGVNKDKNIITHNLWYCGRVPPIFREVLCDNAKFKEANK